MTSLPSTKYYSILHFFFKQSFFPNCDIFFFLCYILTVQNVFSPVREIVDEILQTLVGQTPEFFVGVDGESGEGVDELAPGHPVRDQPWDGRDHRPEQIHLRLGLIRVL